MTPDYRKLPIQNQLTMAIISKQELKSFSSNLNFVTRNSYLTKTFSLNEAKSRAVKTIFLSHSHSDKDVIEAAVVLLRSIGVNIYIDWKDESMPAITNAATAAKLKENIKKHDRFILLASPAAIKSNWVNWELGYGDAQKYSENIAIFPTEDYSGQWKDAEYLLIYPKLDKTREYNIYSQRMENVYSIVNPDGTKVSLKTWLTR
jgi:hypothetical protein